MPTDDGTVVMEDARLIFRNFSGKEGLYNREGDRNFSVLLDDDIAEVMAKDGWHIKWLKPREEGDLPQAKLEVKVKFGRKPPKIVMISSHNRTILDEDSVAVLDHVYIKTVDLIVRPYVWEVNGKSGVKAYLKSIYVTIEEDELERKYADMEHNG